MGTPSPVPSTRSRSLPWHRLSPGRRRLISFLFPCALGLPGAACGSAAASADAPGTPPPSRPFDLTPAPAPADTRYGPFGLLDHRSRYGTGWFPEPFRVDESDVDNELRLDWEHDQAKGLVSNFVTAEVEKSFGLLTVEVEAPYVVQTEPGFDPATGAPRHREQQGVGNVDVGARFPFFQYVSRDEFFDTTFGFALELGIPTNSPVSKNTELVPKLFNDLRLGEHFSLQTIVGLSYLFGSKPDGGTRTLEYGLIFGYSFEHDEVPLPYVQRTIPMLELVGETGLAGPDSGSNDLTATLGIRFNLDSIGLFQPRLGFGYVFPIDKGGRETVRGGFVTSLVFEY